MKIEILQNPETGTYNWSFYDGPDGINFYQGSESTLGEVFEKIIYYRAINGLGYLSDTLETVTGPSQA